MQVKQSDEFYVGYMAAAPKGIERLLRRAVIVLFIAMMVFGAILVAGQRKLPSSFFEYGVQRDFEGVVRERPVPMLIIERPKGATNVPSESRYTLVAEGKHGAATDLYGFEGRQVRLKGSLIYHEGLTMIEVAKGTVEVIPTPDGPRRTEKRDWLGVQTLEGEIVDSKCYLGVMNPGNRTSHRECAVRCISGGVPALFIVRNFEGASAGLWLTTPDGVAVGREVLDMVAKPVEITGEVTREGDQLYFRAEPRAYRLGGSDGKK